MQSLFQSPPRPGSYYDYRLDSLYSQLLADGRICNQHSDLIQCHNLGQCPDLKVWTLNWPGAARLLQMQVAASPSVLHEPASGERVAGNEELEHYRLLFETLALLKQEDPDQLPLLIENYQTACVPLQEFYLFHQACKEFAPSAACHPYLGLMAFYSAVMVDDRFAALHLEPAGLRFQAMHPMDTMPHAMVGNLLCLHRLRQGAAEAEVLDTNTSIIAALESSEIETPLCQWPAPLQELLSVLYLNRARLLGRLECTFEALAALQRSFAIRRAMYALPDGLTLLYLLYHARWSQLGYTASTLLARFSQPGFCSFSWRLASHFGLPLGTRVIVANRRLALPSGLETWRTLDDLSHVLLRELNN
jgi:hypothetical protein